MASTNENASQILFSLSNVTAGTLSQIESVLSEGPLIERIMNLAQHQSIVISAEALWVLTNGLSQCSLAVRASFLKCYKIDLIGSLLNGFR